ncbi:MAG: FMN-dependent NADH-azoreductase [Thiohalomonadaceae bacterium]
MSTLLQLNSSLFGENGVSTQLADAFVRNWQTSHPQGRLIKRDLITQPLLHMDGDTLGALMSSPDQRGPAQQALVDEADTLINELQQAEVVVIGAPMYNFSVPSQLKSWFDRVARAGVTFRYTEQGAQGLLSGKKVYVFTSRGGLHQGQASDGVTPWLRTILGFLGMDEVEFIYAEGLNLGEQARAEGLAQARKQLSQLAA